jgi:cell division protein FtsI (penicillin-binding protein 3)
MTRFRLGVLASLLFLGLGAVLFRAFQLQILPSEQVARLAKRQLHSRIEIVGRRGILRDRNGRELAVSTNSVSLFANPKILKEPRKAANALGPVLGLPAEAMLSKFREAQGRSFVWLARQLDASQMERLQSVDLKNLPGIGMIREFRREYPLAPLASHVLGFVSVDGHGIEGLEKRLDAGLQGERTILQLRRDALGRPLFTESDQIQLDLNHGAVVELTIDSQIQFSAEKALKEAVEEHEADSGSAVVLDPWTGEVLALANWPTFNPHSPARSALLNRRNRAITDPIEPGSVMKPFVVARALEDRIVRPETRINAGGGSIKVGRKIIREAEASHAAKTVSIVDLIRVSSNVGTVVLQQKMGFPRVEDTFRRLGFGSLTGIELEGESRGIFRSPRPEQKLEQATISFGQGIATTPLQIALGYAAFANGGFRVKPTLLRKEGAAPLTDRVFSEATSAKMRGILEKVVEAEGTGVAARVQGFRVAGKTGTSQRVDFENGGYEQGAYWSSFAGFVPSDKPRFVIYVVVDRPRKNGYYGGVVAAPAFSKIARDALRLGPGGAPEAAPALVPAANPVAAKAKEGAIVTKAPARTERIGPPAARKISAGTGVPDLVGLSIARALRALQEAGLRMEVVGEGSRVASQLPEAGTPSPSSRTVVLRLR